jgi:hypothetical protein
MTSINTPVQNPNTAATAQNAKAASLFGTSATYSGRNTILSHDFRIDSPIGAAGTKAAQLQALLHLTCGESSNAFAGMTVDLRDYLMWLASDLALDIRVLCDLAEQEVAA